MVTIRTFSRVMDADLARMRLESAGIQSLLPDESINSWVLGEGPLVGGVRLQVAEEDAARAQEILAELAVPE